jgi:hypothetical protein
MKFCEKYEVDMLKKSFLIIIDYTLNNFHYSYHNTIIIVDDENNNNNNNNNSTIWKKINIIIFWK